MKEIVAQVNKPEVVVKFESQLKAVVPCAFTERYVMAIMSVVMPTQ